MQNLLAQLVTVEAVVSAGNNDFLAGTQLDQPGVPGVFTIWAACTDDSGRISVSQGSRIVTSGTTIIRRDEAQIRENEDTYFQTLSITGGRPVIAVSLGSSQTVRVRVKFLPGVGQP